MELKRIGVFDSGLGGLSVAKHLLRLGYEVLYVGDTARIPYGTKSPEFVRRCAYELLSFLLESRVDAVVIACHTVSTVAGSWLKEVFKIPIYTMVDLVKAAYSTKNVKKVLVVGTEATVGSGMYEKILRSCGAEEVVSVATPLFVALAEEGIKDEILLGRVFKHYFGSLNFKPESVLLGCTHFPMYWRYFEKYFGVEVIDPAQNFENLGFERKNGGSISCLFTDSYQGIDEKIGNFLEDTASLVKEVRFVKIDIG